MQQKLKDEETESRSKEVEIDLGSLCSSAVMTDNTDKGFLIQLTNIYH
jgi:hypothetical protein